MVNLVSFDQFAKEPAPIVAIVFGMVRLSIALFVAKALSLMAVRPAPNWSVAILGLLLKAPSPSVVTLSGRASAVRPQSAKARSPRVVTPVPNVRVASLEQPSKALVPIVSIDLGMVTVVIEVQPANISAGMVVAEPRVMAVSSVQSRKLFSPSVVAEIFAEVRPVPANASVPMFSIADRLVSTSALHPLNALSPTVLTLDGRVRDASAVHPSNVLSPMISTPVGTVALVRAVQPLKAPAAIEVVFSKNLIVPSFALPASETGNSVASNFAMLKSSVTGADCAEILVTRVLNWLAVRAASSPTVRTYSAVNVAGRVGTQSASREAR